MTEITQEQDGFASVRDGKIAYIEVERDGDRVVKFDGLDVLYHYIAPKEAAQRRWGPASDCPDEYVVVNKPAALGGTIVFGRYDNRWSANCQTRDLLGHLFGVPADPDAPHDPTPAEVRQAADALLQIAIDRDAYSRSRYSMEYLDELEAGVWRCTIFDNELEPPVEVTRHGANRYAAIANTWSALSGGDFGEVELAPEAVFEPAELTPRARLQAIAAGAFVASLGGARQIGEAGVAEIEAKIAWLLTPLSDREILHHYGHLLEDDG